MMKILFLPLILLFVIGCSSDEVTSPERELDLVGEILEVNPDETLLVGDPTNQHHQAILSILPESVMVGEGDNPLAFSDLKPGMQVEVWAFEIVDVEPGEGTLEFLKMMELE